MDCKPALDANKRCSSIIVNNNINFYNSPQPGPFAHLNPQDIKNLFGVNVDFVGNQTVFDVGGNKIRAITKIEFGVKIVLVTHVLTHNEYDKDKWKK